MHHLSPLSRRKGRVTGPAFGSSPLPVGSLTSGVANSHGVTGGVYKTRERIHRDMLIRDY